MGYNLTGCGGRCVGKSQKSVLHTFNLQFVLVRLYAVEDSGVHQRLLEQKFYSDVRFRCAAQRLLHYSGLEVGFISRQTPAGSHGVHALESVLNSTALGQGVRVYFSGDYPVRILVVTNQLVNRAGSELFTVNLCRELRKRQIEVAVFAPFLGATGSLIRGEGIFVTDKFDDLSSLTFDVIHAQHNIPAIIARSLFPTTPMILMVHGGIAALEQPPSIPLGISRYVAVSERIKYHLIRDCGIDERSIDIVRSFIDIDKFHCTNPVNIHPRRLLVLSNHYIHSVRSVIYTACRDLNIDVVHVGMPNNPVHDVAEWINRADIVVTLGRGVLEAAACERNIILYDHFGGDGLVTPDNFVFLRQRSFLWIDSCYSIYSR